MLVLLKKHKDFLWGLAIGVLWCVGLIALELWDERIGGPTTPDKPFTDNRAFELFLLYFYGSLVILPILAGLRFISMRRFWGIIIGVGITLFLVFFFGCIRGC